MRGGSGLQSPESEFSPPPPPGLTVTTWGSRWDGGAAQAFCTCTKRSPSVSARSPSVPARSPSVPAPSAHPLYLHQVLTLCTCLGWGMSPGNPADWGIQTLRVKRPVCVYTRKLTITAVEPFRQHLSLRSRLHLLGWRTECVPACVWAPQSQPWYQKASSFERWDCGAFTWEENWKRTKRETLGDTCGSSFEKCRFFFSKMKFYWKS